MNNATHSRKNERVNLLVPHELIQRAGRVAKDLDSSLSELVRTALAHYLETLERKKTEKELKEGYKANAAYYHRMSKDWEAADAE